MWAERFWGWLTAVPGRGLGLALALTAALRLPFAAMPLTNDEGGFLMVARQWHPDGAWLYGDQWVDRPPFLIVVFKLADLLGGSPVAVRLLGLLVALAMVTAAWYAGRLLAGAEGAAAAALVAAAVGSNPLIMGRGLVGDGIAAAFVMGSMAVTLRALRARAHTWPALVLAAASGVLAALAFLTKQNALTAVVFAAVMFLPRVRRHWSLAVAFGVGCALPVALTLLWAASDAGPGVQPLVDAVFTFRVDAAEVLKRSASVAPRERAALTLVWLLLSGILLLLVEKVVMLLTLEEYRSLRRALAVCAAYQVFSMFFSGNWYIHYLLAWTPLVATSAALSVARLRGRHGRPARGSRVLVVVALTGVCAVLPQNAGADEAGVADWLRASSAPGDSVVVAYGSPNVIERSGLTTPYPYSWSLPLRVKDRHLHLLTRTLEGPDAPTWLVEIGDFDWWGLDTARFRSIREDDYEEVGQICGHAVFLRRGLQRSLATPPDC